MSLKVLFWSVCIPVRIGIALLALTETVFLPLLGVLFLAAACGFAYHIIEHISGRAGPLGGLGGKRWWVRTRVLHFGLWSIAAAFALVNDVRAGYVLFVDVALGMFVGFLRYALGITKL